MRFFRSAVLAAAVLGLLPSPSKARQMPPTLPTRVNRNLPFPPKVHGHTFSRSDSIVRVIVQFKEPPLFVSSSFNARLGKTSGGVALYQQRFAQLASDVQASLRSLPGSPLVGAPLTYTFYKTFYGASMSVPSSQMATVLSLPYVKAIYIDQPVKALLDKSAVQIGATQVWQIFGKKGEGVRVGIIDTGIDYTHPALGGGFGPGFKVAGGYDFASHDSDPMDEYGHGTHVAGIVAADSPGLQGIAPKATLYAYKVLNANGTGFWSDVIAGIERTADPDNDDDPSDHLDIANISLGSYQGNPTDPVSTAVNNATRIGVLFCVSAGNAGDSQDETNFYRNGSFSVGSPGTAELAVTVGAVDSVDTLAWFSSKGPNRTTFGIKPDIVAPGVQIRSSFFNASTIPLSGTSMSAPMVSGVAALLRCIHPDWSIDHLRSALINTARDLGLSPYKQGGGRVQALKAATSSAWVKPALLSFGLDDPSVGTWTRQDTIVIHNDDSLAQTFVPGFTGTQGGIGMSVSYPGGPVLPGDSATAVITLTVNNSAIPVVDDDIPLYTGWLRFYGSRDTMNIPWAFGRARRLTLSFNEPYPVFAVSPGSLNPLYYDDPRVGWPSPTVSEIYGLSPGSYDFLTIFSSPQGLERIVIKEQVNLASDSPSLTINSTEATLPLVFQGVNSKGERVSSYAHRGIVVSVKLPSPLEEWMFFPDARNDTLYFSPTSSRYLFRPREYQYDARSSRTFHMIPHISFAGIQSGITLANSPSDVLSQQIVLKYTPGTTEAVLYGTPAEMEGFGFAGTFDSFEDSIGIADERFSMMGYFGRSPDTTRNVGIDLFTSWRDGSFTYRILFVLPITIADDSIIAGMKFEPGTVAPRSPSGGTMTFGGSPAFISATWWMGGQGPYSFDFVTTFLGMRRETRSGDNLFGAYTVYNAGGTIVRTGPLYEHLSSVTTFPEGRYHVVFDTENYRLRDSQGRLKHAAGFDLSSTPRLPPTITSFVVLDGQGQPSDSLAAGGPGTLFFSAKIFDVPAHRLPLADSTKVWYRIHGTSAWTPLAVQYVSSNAEFSGWGSAFRVNLTDALGTDSVGIDLRLFAMDSLGSTVDEEIAPAFAIGTWAGDPPTQVANNARGVPEDFVLEQNYPNPFNPSTTIRFGLPVAGEVRIEIFDLLGRRIEVLPVGYLPPGYHSVDWKANVASGVYIYRLSATSRTRGATMVKKMAVVR